MKTIVFLQVFLLLITFTNAQVKGQTEYSDDFNSTNLNAGWLENGQYQLSSTGASMKIEINKYKPWKGFSLDLGSVYDFSSNPYVNLKVKGEQPFILHIYLVDVNGKYTLTDTRVHETSEFVNLFFDMTLDPQDEFDITQVESMIFTFNGASVSLKGTAWFDDLKVGDPALKLASIGGIFDQIVPKNSTENTILVTDIKNASSISLTGGESLITNVSISPIENSMATITYDAVPDATGKELITLNITGATGFQDNSFEFDMEVEANKPPSIDMVNDIEVATGHTVSVELSGISDGNISCEQQIVFTANSSEPNVVDDPLPAVSHNHGSPYANMNFDVINGGTTTITLTLDDQQDENNTRQIQFDVVAYDDFNNPPTIDKPLKQEVMSGAGTQAIALTGIGDGDDGDEHLTFEATPSDVNVIPTVSVTYEQGAETATLEYTPGSTGIDTIQLTLTDDGGSAQNNGNASTIIEIPVEVRQPALTGYTIPLNDFQADMDNNLWEIGGGETQSIEYVSFDGYDEVLKITMNGKSTWSGLDYRNPELNLTEHPYMVCDVYSVSNEIGFHAYFWDNEGRRNLPGAHDQRKTIVPDTWNTVILDFRGPGMIEDDDGNPINIDRVDSLLFNYHDGFGWPFHELSGTVYIKNIRVGSDAEADVPALTPKTTLDPVADIVLQVDEEEQMISLSGISDGQDETDNVVIEASSNNTGLVPNPVISDVDAQGNASLSFTPASGTGTAEITITVSAPESETIEVIFTVSILDKDPGIASDIVIDPTKRHQVIKGFGTFSNSEALLDLYVNEMGATAMRVGLIGNQIENVNDNNDPYVLNRSALNYSAFDFEYYRKLKEAGVETFILTSWSPPAWMKDNLSLNFQQADVEDNCDDTDNKLSYHYYEEFAESMVAVVRMFQEEAGITLEAIGLQNEPAFHEPYASAILDLVRYPQLIEVVGQRFEEEGITTRFFMPEQAFTQGFNSMEEYIDNLQANPIADAYCDIIATHGYAEDGIQPGTPNYQEWQDMWNNAQEGDNPKELWMTETTRLYEDWSNAIGFAGGLHGALTAGNVSLWTTWSFEGMQVIQGSPTPMLYTASNFFRYIRPGAQRIGASIESEDILVSAFENDDEMNTTAIVIINKSTSAQSIKISGESIPVAYDVFTTSENRNREYMGMIADETVLLPPSSVTTLVEVEYNIAPTIDLVEDFIINENAGNQQITLTGISNGGDTQEQTISVTAESSNPDVIAISDVSYSSPSATAELNYKVTGTTGQSAEITVTVQDDGGTPNGAVDETQMRFTITLDNFTSDSNLQGLPINIYPNPVQQMVHVENIQNAKKISILDISGKILFEQKLDNQQAIIIDTGFLESGIYFIELNSNNCRKKIVKLIKR